MPFSRDTHVTRPLIQPDQQLEQTATSASPLIHPLWPHAQPIITDQLPADGTAQVTTDQLPVDTTRITTDQLPGDAVPASFNNSDQLPMAAPGLTTGQLSPALPRVTRQLAPLQFTTTTRLPTLIPATEKRPERLPPAPPQRRPLKLIIALSSSVIMLILAAFLVTPLGNGQQQPLTQTISNIFSFTSSGTFNPAQHIAPPTPTPALLTNDGYCGGSDIWGTCATAITESGVMGTGQMTRPIIGATITQPFGHPEYQIWCGCVKPHSGIDLAAPYGTPIMAADSGQVIWTGWDWSGLGWAVKINHGHYIATIYGHMSRFIVSVGQNVTRGQVIGYEGSTGASTGPHLHFMVLINNIWVNPIQYVALP